MRGSPELPTGDLGGTARKRFPHRFCRVSPLSKYASQRPNPELGASTCAEYLVGASICSHLEVASKFYLVEEH
jgi:hypothetical protein